MTERAKLEECPKCKQETGSYSPHCGCYVCVECQQHFHKTQILVKCFCGWGVKDDVDRAEMQMNGSDEFSEFYWFGDSE